MQPWLDKVILRRCNAVCYSLSSLCRCPESAEGEIKREHAASHVDNTKLCRPKLHDRQEKLPSGNCESSIQQRLNEINHSCAKMQQKLPSARVMHFRKTSCSSAAVKTVTTASACVWTKCKIELQASCILPVHAVSGNILGATSVVGKQPLTH